MLGIVVYERILSPLQLLVNPTQSKYRVDFTSTRRRVSTHHGSPLLRAISTHGANKRVLDCTGGLGADSFVLAERGHVVHLLERCFILSNTLTYYLDLPVFFSRHPVFFALLRDGCIRARCLASYVTITCQIPFQPFFDSK